MFCGVSLRFGKVNHGLTRESLLLGGRTAWSCIVKVCGTPVKAKFWYDGRNLNNAKEDAAQAALDWLANSGY
jgi:hypothetical protein